MGHHQAVLDHRLGVPMSLGRQLARAELYTQDKHGKRIRRANRHAIGYTVMAVKETPPHALSRAYDETEERTEQEGRAQHELDRLTPEERAVLELQAKRWMVEQECSVDPGEAQKLLDEGWSYVRQESGMVVLKGDFAMHLTYEDIGQRLGLSARQVHRRVVSAHRKLRSKR